MSEYRNEFQYGERFQSSRSSIEGAMEARDRFGHIFTKPNVYSLDGSFAQLVRFLTGYDCASPCWNCQSTTPSTTLTRRDELDSLT
jgi:hypothetical protein